MKLQFSDPGVQTDDEHCVMLAWQWIIAIIGLNLLQYSNILRKASTSLFPLRYSILGRALAVSWRWIWSGGLPQSSAVRKRWTEVQGSKSKLWAGTNFSHSWLLVTSFHRMGQDDSPVELEPGTNPREALGVRNLDWKLWPWDPREAALGAVAPHPGRGFLPSPPAQAQQRWPGAGVVWGWKG